MAENIHETGSPEPPPKPPEVPKPTEQPNRSEDPAAPNESPRSAQEDARNAAPSEHAKAMKGNEPDGLQPTPELPDRRDAHSAAKNQPEGLPPPPEVQEQRDAAEADTAPRDSVNAQAGQDPGTSRPVQGSEISQRPEDLNNGQPPQESQAQHSQDTGDATGESWTREAAQRPQEAAGTVGDRNGAVPAGELAGDHAAAREAAAAEWAKATEGADPMLEGAGPQSPQETNQLALDNEQAQDPAHTTQPPEESRTEEPTEASPPDASATKQQADQNAATDQNDEQQAAGEHRSAAEEAARQPAESTDETTPPEANVQPARRDSRGREIPDEVQRLPSGRLPANWHYAGRAYDGEHWTPDLQARYPDGVQFTNDGFPDFSPYATHTVTFDPQYQGNTTTDFTNANRLANLRRTPDDYTWHHHQDTRTMQLVPLEIHDAIRHAGGRAILRRGE